MKRYEFWLNSAWACFQSKPFSYIIPLEVKRIFIVYFILNVGYQQNVFEIESTLHCRKKKKYRRFARDYIWVLRIRIWDFFSRKTYDSNFYSETDLFEERTFFFSLHVIPVMIISKKGCIYCYRTTSRRWYTFKKITTFPSKSFRHCPPFLWSYLR